MAGVSFNVRLTWLSIYDRRGTLFRKIEFFRIFFRIMNICHYLIPDNIVILDNVKTKDELLKTLAYKLAEINNIKTPERLAEAILKREKESSTFLPTGIAIPHARIEDIEEITIVMGVLPEGFKEAPDAESTYLVLLFFSPTKDKEFGRHLKLLSKIAAVFRDPTFVKEIAGISDKDKIFSLIQHQERRTEE